MKVADQLTTKQKQQLERMKSPKREQFSRKEIKELMGINQPTYKRVHGAIRNK
jgi:predicted XRE-type DNA-binding protein